MHWRRALHPNGNPRTPLPSLILRLKGQLTSFSAPLPIQTAIAGGMVSDRVGNRKVIVGSIRELKTETLAWAEVNKLCLDINELLLMRNRRRIFTGKRKPEGTLARQRAHAGLCHVWRVGTPRRTWADAGQMYREHSRSAERPAIVRRQLDESSTVVVRGRPFPPASRFGLEACSKRRLV